MAYTKAALTSIAEVKAFFELYAKDNTSDVKGNPFWSLYAGEQIGKERIGFNWHISDPVKSWELLNSNLAPYESKGGTFYLTLSDKGRDNAPSAMRLICFDRFRNNESQQQGSINGISTGAIGNVDKYVEEKVEFLMLKKEVETLKNGGDKMHPVIAGFMNNPRFDPNALINGLMMLCDRVMGGQPQPIAAVPQNYYPTQQLPSNNMQATETEQQQTQQEYTYDSNKLVFGLDKIRNRLQGVQTEDVIVKLGSMIETMNPYELQFIMSKLGFNYDMQTGVCSPIQ
jgi:hypothetical protein